MVYIFVVFLASVCAFAILGILIFKIGHEMYMTCKREELEFEKERKEK